jgi:hypothetical protein
VNYEPNYFGIVVVASVVAVVVAAVEVVRVLL